MKQLSAPVTIAALCAFFCVMGDPGYRLNPVGWAADSDKGWSRDFGGFVLHTRGVGGLIGERFLDPEFSISGNSEPIQIKGAILRTKDSVYEPKRVGDSTIPAKCNHECNIAVSWEFDEGHSTPEIVGDSCEIVLRLIVGSETRDIKVEFQKHKE